MKKAVTIRSVAEHVGLSIASVSAILSNRHVERRMAPQTVERVLKVAKELGYVPNLAGRRLRSLQGDVRQIDLAIITSYEAPLALVSQIVKVLQGEVDKLAGPLLQFNLSIEMFHAGSLSQTQALLDASRYNGALIANTLPADDEFLAKTRLSYPVVLIGRRVSGCSCIFETLGHVGRNAASILMEAGAKHPAILYSGMQTQSIADRIQAFSQECLSSLDKEPTQIVSESFDSAATFEAMRSFLRSGAQLDGLFATTDSLAAGAYRALREAGLQIGSDVAVVSVGDSEFVDFFDPPLTTLVGQNYKLLERAATVLLQHVTGTRSEVLQVGITPLPVINESSRLLA
ncbi:LacI family DNA-binding transcriptional regulator [Ruficoccus amylovorans]|uniref:LacI family DNA-binding transcriptional regulator n=1 Tax=Ruficoccus amylovorans TaxID=1804625 RepID=A0A842HA85_9BACT|nr:LacI family DNA-binding transcriptional regulator [Ruficoccus amylovorans]MBC2592636.1 LacI family DNA-binding transcriptional regulator [Ruficoccus amylovorans]